MIDDAGGGALTKPNKIRLTLVRLKLYRRIVQQLIAPYQKVENADI